MKKKKAAIQSGDTDHEITLINHNRLLFRMSYPLVLGKTGYTKTARHCYASIAYFNDNQYAIVILKSRKPWTDMENLLKLVKNKK
jgi:D-alanyl-D-alanine carboxypeptidase